MKWTRWHMVAAEAARIAERLRTIRTHVRGVRRRLGRTDAVARAEAHEHLDAIEEHLDRAVTQLGELAHTVPAADGPEPRTTG